MSSVIHFKRVLDSLNLEEIKRQADRSWLSSQTMPTEIVDALLAEIERLQSELEQVQSEVDSDIGYLELANETEAEAEQLRRELHNEQIRRDEWEKMYNQAIAGTKVEQLQERLGQVKTTLDHEVDSRVRAELEVERLQEALKSCKETT